MNIIKEIENLNIGEVVSNASLKDYTTYKLEGNINCVVIPDDVNSLIKLLKFLRDNSIKYKIIGNGSNLIFNSNYDGVLIKLDSFQNLEIVGNRIVVGAGYPLMKLALRVSRQGLSGLEFATGIPGTIGGAVFMNAGAYKSDMGYVVSSVKVLNPDLEIEILDNRELDFHYRTSFLQKHFGFTLHTHIDIHTPIHPKANINNINEGTNKGIASANDFFPSIKSRRVNSSKSDVNGNLSVAYSL